MSRFNDRTRFYLNVDDERFEACSTQVHFRNARGSIERIRNDGRDILRDHPDRIAKWDEYCNDLLRFLCSLGKRRLLDKDRLEIVLREYFALHEHSVGRCYQLMYSRGVKTEIESILDWFSVVYKYSTSAIVSFWLEDKHEENRIHIDMRLTLKEENGESRVKNETTVECFKEQMKVPKKYKHAMRRI